MALCLCAAAACGFGTYDDSGRPDPGQWWPWVCPDGAPPTTDAGCVQPDGGELSPCASDAASLGAGAECE
jgi:hypothetical protein